MEEYFVYIKTLVDKYKIEQQKVDKIKTHNNPLKEKESGKQVMQADILPRFSFYK